MVDNSRRDRVGLGVIGLGPHWEQQYRETLGRLQNRLRIRLVYDPVVARARSVAAELGADCASSLRQLVHRQTLQGLLVLDPGWCGSGVLSLILHSRRPVYLARPVLQHEIALREVLGSRPDQEAIGRFQRVDEQLMPELGLRFTPASCRLRELIATKLGPCLRISIECNLLASLVEVASVIDWCNHIMGTAPIQFANVVQHAAEIRSVELEYPAIGMTAQQPSPRTRSALIVHLSADESSMRIRVECLRGKATLENRTRIKWETAGETGDEFLGDERTEVEILIDQFCRRALGGLNPVGRLSEFVSAIELFRSIRSQNT
jgi:hypothetical protein